MTTLLAAAVFASQPFSGHPSQAPNTLTDAERRAGWTLLFDGVSTKGWHNFQSKGVSSGWVVKDGILTSVDPDKAGDIVSDRKFEWFELTLEANLTKGGNSGIMFRVDESGKATWHSGPEVQLYDHPQQDGVETLGYLYQLYRPEKGVDAAKTAGQWNHLRIVLSPHRSFTEVNGVRYYEYVYGSNDFWDRAHKSKFTKFPGFAKAKRGSIAIQGDHGVVSFRNIKIREIPVPFRG